MLHLVIKSSGAKSVSGRHCFGISSIWGWVGAAPQESCKLTII